MKKLFPIVALSLMWTLSAQAEGGFLAEAMAPICADGVSERADKPGYWYTDYPQFAVAGEDFYSTKRVSPNRGGEYAVVVSSRVNPAQWKEFVRFPELVQDISVFDGKLWVLLANRLKGIDLATRKVVVDLATATSEPADFHEIARAFVWAGNSLVIAHGARGMVIYDLKTNSMSPEIDIGLGANGHLSKATDVSVINDSEVAFTVEGVTLSNEPPFAFSGIFTVKLGGGVGRYEYDRKQSGSLSMAALKVAGDKVVINNWGLLHLASLSGMKRMGRVDVKWIPVRFNVGGKSVSAELLGETLVEDGKILSCAKVDVADEQSHKVKRKGVLFVGDL